MYASLKDSTSEALVERKPDLVEFFVDVPPRLYRLLAEINGAPLPHDRQEHTVDGVRVGGQHLEIVLWSKVVERIVVHHYVVDEEEEDDEPSGYCKAENHLYHFVRSRADSASDAK